MFIDARSAADIRRSIARGARSGIDSLGPNDIKLSLAAALDLVLHSLGSTEESAYTAKWLGRLDSAFVHQIQDALHTSGSYHSNVPFTELNFEAFPIRRLEDVKTNEWVLFRARFAKSAGGGKKGNLYHGISSVLAEMGDNVGWHAPNSPNHSCLGVAAYQVSKDVACFSVADDGRGFLKSLRTNPKWSHLATERGALEAILFRQASSRLSESTGAGFAVLYNKLLSVNASVLIRTGSCTATLRSHLSFSNKVVFREGENIPGAQVTVIVAKAGAPIEIPVEDNP
jgi:hypothetical protein